MAIDIRTATSDYEAWLGRQTTLVDADLKLKHAQMAAGAFEFLRATYYFWSLVFPDLCPELVDAPQVLSCGDLHLANFGTWRDAEGRLIWGINDFDEAAELPYVHDLVRLATSALIARRSGTLQVEAGEICSLILEGYQKSYSDGPMPFVLAERHGWLAELAIEALRDPSKFWTKLDDLPTYPADVPTAARQALESLLPQPGLPYRVVHHVAGLGSLGRQRFTAIADWRGGRIAREAKPLVLSAAAWAAGNVDGPIRCADILQQAVRCADPFVAAHEGWIVRRIAPDCARVDVAAIARTDQARLLKAMGRETGNIHLGTSTTSAAVKSDLHARGGDWLHDAAHIMADAMTSAWKDWAKGGE